MADFMQSSKKREQLMFFIALMIGFVAAIGFSAYAATTISTNVTTGGDVYATSTIQATGNLVGYGDLLAGGTTTATVTGFNLGGVAGTHADAYLSGGLGVGNATTTDGSIEANVDLVIYDDGWIKSGLGIGTSATSTAGSASLSADLVAADDGWFQGGFAIGTAATSTAGSANLSADLVAADDGWFQGGFAIGTAATSTAGSAEVGADLVVTDDAWVKTGFAVGTSATSTAGAIDTTGNVHIGGNLQLSTGTAINKILFSGTCTVNPPALAAMGNDATGDTAIGDKGNASCTDATGVTTSSFVFMSGAPAGWINDVIIVNASSTADNTINFVFKNTSTTTANNIGSLSIPWFAIQ